MEYHIIVNITFFAYKYGWLGTTTKIHRFVSDAYSDFTCNNKHFLIFLNHIFTDAVTEHCLQFITEHLADVVRSKSFCDLPKHWILKIIQNATGPTEKNIPQEASAPPKYYEE